MGEIEYSCITNGLSNENECNISWHNIQNNSMNWLHVEHSEMYFPLS